MLAGTGTSQQGPSMSCAIWGAARLIDSGVGIFSSRAMRRVTISSGFGWRYPRGTYFAA